MAIDNPEELGEGLADEAQVKERNRKIRLSEVQRKEVVARVMSDVEGRAWMFDLLTACHIFHETGPADAARMAFDKGERNIGLRISSMISLHDYVTMLEEQSNG